MNRTGWRVGVVVGVMLGSTACSTLRMVPPPDVTRDSDVLEATDRSLMRGAFVDESFELGAYRVAGVDRDWSSSDSSTILGFSKDEIQTAYAFEFREGAEKLAAQCTSLTDRRSFSPGDGWKFGSSEESRLVCTCGVDDAAVKLELAGDPDEPTGIVTLASGTFAVTTIHETNAAWNPGDPAGFRVDRDGVPVGAVEVLHPGRMWLSRTLDASDRRQLGCLLAGVMLYAEPSED